MIQLTSLVLLASLGSGALEGEGPLPLGRQIDAFTLSDYLGSRHSLDDWKDKKAVAIVFLGTECPLAKLYGRRLAELSKKYESRGVQFVGVNSNRQDTLAEIAYYVRKHKIDFPMLKDPAHKVADQFAAQRTPEAFLLDKDRLVRYHGSIDDQYGVGFSRADATRNHLAAAIEDLLAGKRVSTPSTKPIGCIIGRASRKAPRGDVTYSRQIARIFQKHCVDCHRPGQIGPFSLTSYDDAAAWAETICEVIRDQRMPPWHANENHGRFLNDARMSDREKELVYRWTENGVPQGDVNDLPPAKSYYQGWRIPKPDVVYQLPKPYKVQAKGVVPYQYFYVDPGFEEDVWVKAAEARPGNRAVVHHLILFYIPPGQKRHRPEDPLFNAIAAFAPGMPAGDANKGFARRIPAGSKLAFQVHYTPNGSEQWDRSEAGVVFADPQDVKKELQIGMAFNFRFRIPPGAANHRVRAQHRFGQDVLVYSLTPHMHLRGKSFQYKAVYPDKSEEVLLDVPRYDFNWQSIYILEKPKRMPEGTVLHCTAYFDNSADNLVNPDATKSVYWGDQTWEEMMVGTFAYSLAHQDLSIGPPTVKHVQGDEFEVRFRYRPSTAVEKVYLAGSFNDWKPTGHALNGPDQDGWHHTTVRLEKGRYEYKFVLDGKTWKHDPGNREQAGSYRNSVLHVGD